MPISRRQLRERVGAMQRAAGLLQQRIGRLHVIAAGRSVPDRLVEDDRGAERIGQAGDGVGQIDAAEALVGEAAALARRSRCRRPRARRHRAAATAARRSSRRGCADGRRNCSCRCWRGAERLSPCAGRRRSRCRRCARSSFSGAGEMCARIMSRLAWKPPSAITTDGALNLAAPRPRPSRPRCRPDASFSARARVPRRMRPWRFRRFASSRCSATSPAYPARSGPKPLRHGGDSTLVW